jgi:hypothetical protein
MINRSNWTEDREFREGEKKVAMHVQTNALLIHVINSAGNHIGGMVRLQINLSGLLTRDPRRLGAAISVFLLLRVVAAVVPIGPRFCIRSHGA